MEKLADYIKALEVRIYPDPILKTVCKPVDIVTDDISALIKDMFVTMYSMNGVGLSANQVGVDKRIFVMDTSASGQKRRAFINPEILQSSDIERCKEGCLSFPGVSAYVKRPNFIKIKAMNEEGNTFELDLQGVDAICFQHELDHLNGITFYDHLSQLQKNLIKKKMFQIKK